LNLFRSISINCYTFKPKFISHKVYFSNIINSCFISQINSFWYSIINIFLKNRLNLQMPFRFNIMGCYKNFFNIIWYIIKILYTTLFTNFFHNFFRIQTSIFQLFFKKWFYLIPLSNGNLSFISKGKYWFYTRRTVRNYAYWTSWCYCCNCCVSNFFPIFLMNTSTPCWKNPSFYC